MEVPTSLLTSLLALIVLFAMNSSAAFLKKDVANLRNSPIYYIASPFSFGAQRPMTMSNGGFSTSNLYALNNALSALSSIHSQPAVRPSFGISNLYRLPIKYMSNAKPIDVAGKL